MLNEVKITTQNSADFFPQIEEGFELIDFPRILVIARSKIKVGDTKGRKFGVG